MSRCTKLGDYGPESVLLTMGGKGGEGRLPRDFAAKNGCRVPSGRSLPYAFRMLHSSNCSALGAVGNSWPVRRLTMFGSGDKQPLLVAGIGYELGFEDPSYFSRFIRRELKTSPAEFRSLIRQKYQKFMR